jgi:hypothetical protein
MEKHMKLVFSFGSCALSLYPRISALLGLLVEIFQEQVF